MVQSTPLACRCCNVTGYGCKAEKCSRNNDRPFGVQFNTLEWRKLADSNDENLDVKLMSLKSVWDDIITGFHKWFIKNWLDKKILFKQPFFMSYREKLKIDWRYYSNGLESTHRLLIKKLQDISSSADVRTVSENLTKRLNSRKPLR